MPQQPRFGAVHFQGALMCCEDHDREPCPHDPARRCEGCPGGSTAATVAQAAPAAVAEPVEDPVTVPRGLLGAACWAIERKHDAPKTVEHLRRYTTGDLSTAAPAAAQPVAGEPPEPLGWRVDWPGEGGQTWHQVFINEADALDKKLKHPGSVCSPLYTTPPALVGLSDEQIWDAAWGAGLTEGGEVRDALAFAHAIQHATAAANGMTLREPRDN